MMPLTDTQIAAVRQHAQTTLRTVTSDSIAKLTSDYQLSILEIGIASVLEDIVEALPSPSYEEVKQLLEARERLWNECYSQDTPEG
jgi:DNA polymerase III psi subunit